MNAQVKGLLRHNNHIQKLTFNQFLAENYHLSAQHTFKQDLVQTLEQLFLSIRIKRGYIELNNSQAEAQLPAHLKYLYRVANTLSKEHNNHQIFPNLCKASIHPLKTRLISRLKQRSSTKV
ncbi:MULTISPECIES: hypothetical protein [Acinetobacter calcoaceticus/baumannii complex]|uniref:hypothetical protein n=1 Tax=Acinetobacter calcoaceticus/baumannii complex TaxID=909768 RepID=UPI0004479885|nr:MULTISPECIES: hypothetical protein [Acinetobacter calcoaceticus/baumannii complex]MDU6283896.1 hypothetical protein [Acinetobacter sp.]EXE27087.1 hypothetical protein J569_1743 [Acinetobacter sp. 907131]KCX14110.1 hypothetical protein J723_3602 [Acinetobacter sp. 1264765]MDO0888736.1 hypothetical protein [Acinetobacter pittii]MDP7847939.1 hypothetical protein [Acinetobacter pittii]